MRDPAQRDARASLFADFVEVEQHKLRELFDSNQTSFARVISQVPNRSELQADADRRFNAVKHRFVEAQKKPSGKEKFRKYWYEGNLSDLAKDVGYHDEYAILQRMLSAMVHSTPWALLFGPPMKQGGFLSFAYRFAFRVLGKVAEYHQIQLSSDVERMLIQGSYERFDKNPFIVPPP